MNDMPTLALQLSFQGLPLHAHAFIHVSLWFCIPHKLPFVKIPFGLVPLTCLPPSLKQLSPPSPHFPLGPACWHSAVLEFTWALLVTPPSQPHINFLCARASQCLCLEELDPIRAPEPSTVTPITMQLYVTCSWSLLGELLAHVQRSSKGCLWKGQVRDSNFTAPSWIWAFAGQDISCGSRLNGRKVPPPPFSAEKNH